MQVEVSRSTDGANTFDVPVRVTNSNVGDEFLPWISISQDEQVAVTWLDRRNDPVNTKYQPFFSISDDGINFGTSRFLSTTLSDPGLSFSYLGESRSHVWVNNTVFATWMDTRSGEPRIELGGVQF